MIALLRPLSLRQLRKHPARLGLMVLSVALGVAAWTATHVLDRTLGGAVTSASSPLPGSGGLQVSGGELGVPVELASKIRAVPGVGGVRPILIRRVLVTRPIRREALMLGVVGVGEASKEFGEDLAIQSAPAGEVARGVLAGGKPILLGQGLSDELPQTEKTLDVLIDGRTHKLARAGVVKGRGPMASLGGSVLVADLATAGGLAGSNGRVSRMDVALVPGSDPATVRKAIAAAIGTAGEVRTPEDHSDRMQEAIETLRLGFALCGLGALGLALLLTAGSFSVGIAERRREVGLLRALGAERSQVGGLFLCEAAVLGAVGSGLGLPLGYAIARLASGSVLQAVGDVFVAVEAKTPELEPATALGAFAAGVFTTIVAALVPTIRAATREPLASLDAAPASSRRTSRRLTLVAPTITLSIAAASFTFSPEGSGVRIYLPIALGILAVILAIPLVTATAARLLRPLAGRLLGPAGWLAADRLIQHPSGDGFAIASLVGGVALILQTGGVIHGNEQAIRHWVETCIAGDVFVTSGGPLSASGRTHPMDPDLSRRIHETLPRSRPVPLSFRRLPWLHGGRETRVMVLALDARAYVNANVDREPPLGDLELYRRLSEPGTALVSENFSALYGVGVGDAIELPGAGGPLRLKVVGTVLDFASSRGQVTVDRAQFAGALGIDGVDVFSVSLPPGPGRAAEIDAAVEALAKAPWAAERALVVVPWSHLRDHILGMVGRLYGVAYVQEVAAAIVAALGVATALLISVLQRRRELGLMRAVGATKAQAFAVLLGEAGLMGLIGAGAGVALGFALEWYVLRVVLLEETGFNFPVLFPATHAATVAALGIGVALLAGVGPALRAGRLRVADAIAYE